MERIEDIVSRIAAMYPEVPHLWRTSDGLLHLDKEGAMAQAAHLQNAEIEKVEWKTAPTLPK